MTPILYASEDGADPSASAPSIAALLQVLLDVAAIQPDRILLLDTYFMVVVFYGSTIAEWRRAKYHEQPEHQAFR